MDELDSATVVASSCRDVRPSKQITASAFGVERGSLVGRYVVLNPIGRGGMGEVHAAYDPELDRKIALKLLRSDQTDSPSHEARSRMLREAQTLAKLNHPHVVTIHDVGEHEGGLYLAMEYVEGATLRDVLRQHQPSPLRWVEVLELLLPAARGLAAAHRQSIVHRDFKPANVMVAHDGTVKVMDFGLARIGPEAAANTDPRLADHSSASDEISVTGSIVGTPAYMAPEQFLALPVDARTDQFAWCVTLWEALYGERPFAGSSTTKLADDVKEGRRRNPPDTPKVPTWLRRVCERGLSNDPQKRYPSMDALLSVCRRGLQRHRQRPLWLGAGLIGASAMALLAGRELERLHTQAECQAQADALAELWHEDARQSLRRSLGAVPSPASHATIANVMPWLDEWASTWQSTRRETCLQQANDTNWRYTYATAADLCLAERRRQFASLTEEFMQADTTVLHHAVLAAASLASARDCIDQSHLYRQSPPPLAPAADLAAAHHANSRARVLGLAGRYEAGRAQAESAIALASQLGYAPLLAEAELALGRLLASLGHYEAATKKLSTAYQSAGKAGASQVAADAAIELIDVVGLRLERHGEGLTWNQVAEVTLAQLEADGDGLLTANRLTHIARLHGSRGEYEKARTNHERALALREQILGTGHPTVAASINSLADIHYDEGEYEAARALFERALLVREQSLGADHPDVADSLMSLANLHLKTAAYDEAMPPAERALRIKEAGLGPEHPDIAKTLNTMANIEFKTGRFEAAIALHQRALAIKTKALGPRHSSVAATYTNLGNVYHDMGDYEAAKTAGTTALEIWIEALGPDHPNVGVTMTNLSNPYRNTGDLDRAKELLEGALVVWQKSLGPEHPNIAVTLSNLANIAKDRGQLDEAKTLHERAIAIKVASVGAEHPDVATSINGLGNVLFELGRLDEAEAQYERALAIFRATVGPNHIHVATCLADLGLIASAKHDPALAVTRLEQAVAIVDAASGQQTSEPGMRFELAKALMVVGANRQRAIELARQAIAGWHAMGQPAADDLAEATTWLRRVTAQSR